MVEAREQGGSIRAQPFSPNKFSHLPFRSLTLLDHSGPHPPTRTLRTAPFCGGTQPTSRTLPVFSRGRRKADPESRPLGGGRGRVSRSKRPERAGGRGRIGINSRHCTVYTVKRLSFLRNVRLLLGACKMASSLWELCVKEALSSKKERVPQGRCHVPGCITWCLRYSC